MLSTNQLAMLKRLAYFSLWISLAVSQIALGKNGFTDSSNNSAGLSTDPELNRIVVIDSAVNDYKYLIQANRSTSTRFVYIKDGEDLFAKLGSILSKHATIESIHIVSHGQAGMLFVAGQYIDASYLSRHQSILKKWSSLKSSEMDLFIYGCDVAKGKTGENFIQQLAQLTGFDIAASSNKTGASVLGGDWDLEYIVGQITEKYFADRQSLEAWTGLLDITTGLQAHWTLDTNTNDSSGNSYNGTLTNGAVIDTASATNKVGGGKVSLDGSNDSVDASAHVANFSSQTEGTISAWIKTNNNPSADNGNQVIFGLSDFSGTDHAWLALQNGQLEWHIVASGSEVIDIQSRHSLNDDSWHHVAVTVDSGGTTLYVDGTALSASVLHYYTGNSGSTEFFDDATGLDNMQIGISSLNSVAYGTFGDLIDDVRVYNRALSAADITELVQYHTAFTISQTGGTTIVDESGASDSISVVLNYPPTSDVVIDLTILDASEYNAAPGSVTFTSGNWDTAQNITISRVDDALNDDTQVSSLQFSINDASSDDLYDPLADQFINIYTLDDENTNSSPINDIPISQTVVEDSFLIFNAANDNLISIIDDAAETLVVNLSVGNGTLTLSQTTGLTFTTGNGTADATMQFSGTKENINSALDGLRYDPTANSNGNDTLTLTTEDQDVAVLDNDANLLAYYKFDANDTDGDSGPNSAPDGTFVDNATTVTDSERGSVLSLDGVDDAFTVPSVFGTPATMTLSAWANLTTVDNSASEVVSLGNNIMIRADYNSGSSVHVFLGSGFERLDSNVYIEDTGWRHLVYTFDGATYRAIFYIDGVEVANQILSGPNDWGLQTTTVIGKHGGASTNFDFGGRIDDVRLFDRVLTPGEVTTYYGPFNVSDTDTVTITVTPANDTPGGSVSIDDTTPEVADTLNASNTLSDTDGLSGAISYQWQRDGVDISGATSNSYTVVLGDTGSVLSVVASYTDDDGTPESVSSAGTAAVVNNFDFTIVESGGNTGVNESGTTDTFTVVLDKAPSSDVVIDISSGDTGEATVSPASLTFTTGNWNSTQTVTVTGVNDAIIDGNQNTTITVSVNDAASDDNYDPAGDQTVTATTVDNDVAGFTVTETGGTSVNESGTTDTFTVVLTAQPDSNVVIDVSSGDTGEATVNPTSLTFTSGNWNAAQTVTVTGIDDTLIDGDQNTTITLSVNDAASDNNFDPVSDQTVTATTVDNDTAGFTVTETGGTSVNESGTTDTFTVVLDAQPNSNVVVDVSSGDTGEATVSPSPLTFTTGNWNIAQTVTVTGVNDFLIDGDQNTTITLSVNDTASDNNFDLLSDQTVTATTVDNDSAGFTVTETGGTSVNESGTTDTFTVALDAQPDSNVVIDVSSGDTGEATINPTPLTFTTGNWNMAQTVTVTGVNDALIDGDQNTAITLSINDAASDNNFDPLSDQTVTATTVDNDSAGFTITETGGTSVNESGTTDTFTVVLDAQPNSNVVIDVSSGDTGEATISPTPLTFTTGNWNVAQTVTVTGVNDALIDGDQNTTITLSINDAASDNNFDPLGDQTVTATTVDNDSAGFTITETGGTSVNESGTTDTFTVVLTAQPTSNVVIDVSSGDITEATVAPASLTFTTGNWNVVQTVTVTGVDDAVIDGNQNTTVTLSVNDVASDNNFDPLADQTVIATTVDNDAAGFTVTETGSTSVNESGTTDIFTVVLDAQPNSNVVIDIASADTGEVTVNPTPLTFTTANWNVAQTVTVTGVNDALIDGNQNTTLTLSVNDAASDNNFDPLVDQTVTATTVDNDAAGFTITEIGGTSVNESGTTDTFTVVLDAEPNSNVFINISSADTGEATINPTPLIFTAGNWNIAQAVTVTGVDDALIDGNQNTTLTLSINDAASDDNFDPLADQTVTATTVDNDIADFTVTETGGTSVSESGTSDTFTVVLTAQPNSNVVIDVSSGDTGEATISPSPLTFTNANWNIAQTVTVTGVDDVLIDGNQNTTITLAINDAASDNNFDPLANQTVTATTIDDDAAGFTVTESGGTSVNESGTTDTFTVVLNTAPASNVVIDISSADTGEATVSPASLTFTSGNWNVAQTVTVTGVDDSLIDGDQNTTITLSVNDAASDDNFDPLPNQTVTATTVDDDSAGFTVTETGGTSVNESGTTDTFTVVLASAPASNVVIDVSSGDTGEATVAPASLTFTASNWHIAQTVTVTGVDDALIDGNQNTTITLAVNDALSDNNFDPLADQTITATTVDDDAASFSVIETGIDTSVAESGTTDTFTVVLNSAPASNVVFDVTSADTGEATVAPASLTFAPGNWAVPQMITVTGVDDVLLDGSQNTAITIAVNDAASDDNFDPLADQTVTATTIDDDIAGFNVTESGIDTAVDESGTTDNFTVVLTSQPGSDVVIDISSSDTGEATVSPASLTFTSVNWNIAQAVTVTGVDDALVDGAQNSTLTIAVNDAGSDDAFDPLPDQFITASTIDDDVNLDDDNDGIPNIIEGLIDTDMDGTNDYLDIDSDNDGIPDGMEETNIPPLSGLDDDSDLIDNVIDVDLTAGSDINANGIDDAFEPIDSDSDGSADHLDVDSDNDGVPDGLEADNVPTLTFSDADSDGVDDALDIDITGGPDNNGNGADDLLEPRDTESDGRQDYLDIDSDNDGILDSTEANVAGGDIDGDGIDDRFDVDQTAGIDADNDGVDDAGATDTDSDARPDYRELDSDNDGIADVIEAALLDIDLNGYVDNSATTSTPPDSDIDGTPDYRDVDSDNDGIFDIVNAGYTTFDTNNDGQIDPSFFIDPDFDGVPNGIDQAPVTFGLAGDGDGDGIDNALDADDDNDGVPDSIEAPGGIDIDSDGDGLFDRLDKDSDNDGLPDTIEGFQLNELDIDQDGEIDNTVDADGNGLADVVATNATVQDSDQDGTPDFLDLDSDNDGLNDLYELALSNIASFDANGDGRLDNVVDLDIDGLADIIDPVNANGTVFTVLDSDGDGIPNFRDTDSDNDTFSDGEENGDYNENGQLDFLEDGGGIKTFVSGGGGNIGLQFLYCLLLIFGYRRKRKCCGHRR